MYFSQFWSMAAFIKKPNSIVAGPLIVILKTVIGRQTEVLGLCSMYAEYKFFGSTDKSFCMLSLPFLPYITTPSSCALAASALDLNAVDQVLSGKPSRRWVEQEFFVSGTASP